MHCHKRRNYWFAPPPQKKKKKKKNYFENSGHTCISVKGPGLLERLDFVHCKTVVIEWMQGKIADEILSGVRTNTVIRMPTPKNNNNNITAVLSFFGRVSQRLYLLGWRTIQCTILLKPSLECNVSPAVW